MCVCVQEFESELSVCMCMCVHVHVCVRGREKCDTHVSVKGDMYKCDVNVVSIKP